MDDPASTIEGAAAALRQARTPSEAVAALQALASRAQALGSAATPAAPATPSGGSPPGTASMAALPEDAVLAAMRAHGPDAKVLELGCRALAALSVSPRSQIEIVRRGGAEALVASLRAATPSPTLEALRRYSLRALRNVASLSEGATACERAGALDALAAVAAAYPAEHETLKVACGMLRNAALRGTELRSPRALSAALDVSIGAATSHPTLAELQEAALGAVWALAAVASSNGGADASQTAAQSTQPGQAPDQAKWLAALDASSAALLAHKESTPVLEAALRAVAFICAGSTEMRRSAAIGRPCAAAVCAAMAAQLSSQVVQERGCLALANLAGGSGDTQAAVAKAGGVAAACEALGAHPSAPSVCEHALAALYNMSLNSEARTAVAARQTSLCAAAAAMVAHKAAPQLLLNGCRLFGIMATTRENQFNVSQCGAPEALIAAIGAHGPPLAESALWALSNVCACQSARQALAKSETATDAISGAMAMHKTNANIQESGCRVLGLLGTAPVVDVVLTAMEEHRSNASVQQAGCGSLWRMMSACNANRVAATSSRCTETVLAAMAAHRKSASVQKHGCHVMMELALKNSENGATLAKMGGVRAALRALRKHSGSQSVAEVACGALRNIAASPAACEVFCSLDGVKGIVKALHEHQNSESVADHVTAVLCRVAARTKGQAAESLGEPAVIEIVVNSMRTHISSRAVQKHACGFFWNAHTTCPDMIDKADEYGILEAVLQSMQATREQERIQEGICKLLLALAVVPGNRPRLAQYGAINVISSVLSANRENHSVSKNCHELLERIGEYADGGDGPRIRADLLKSYQDRYAISLNACLEDLELCGAITGEGNSVMLSAKHVPTGEMVVVKVIESSPAKKDAKWETEREILKVLPMNEGISHPAAAFSDIIPASWASGLPDRPRLRGWMATSTRLLFVLTPFHGESLNFVMQIQSKPLTQRIAKDWLRQLLTALEFLRENQVVHRDLVPEHILIDPNNHVKLIDFGTAIKCDNKDLKRTVPAGKALWGHPFSIPPEVAAKKSEGELGPVEVPYGRADLFSAALSFWDSLSPLPVLQKLRTSPTGQAFTADPANLTPLPPGLEGLSRVLTALMNKDPEQRLSASAAIAMLAKQQ